MFAHRNGQLGRSRNYAHGYRRPPVMSLICMIICVMYVIAATLDIVSFTIWPSVKEFLGELDPYLYFEKDWRDIWLSPWGIRTGIAIPSLLLSEVTPLTQEQSFGMFCGLCLVFTVFIINSTLASCFGSRSLAQELVVTGIILGLGYFMNGRLCSAFLGSALMMRAHLSWISGKMQASRVLLHNFLALPLMTVSSGTFLVGLMTVIVWAAFAFLDLRTDQEMKRLRANVLIGMLPIMYLAGVQASQFTGKLYDYYQGDMIQVLYHGYGDVIQSFLPELTLGTLAAFLVLCLPIAVFAMFSLMRSLSWVHRYLFLVCALSICMGACGYSTMFTNTPSIVLCCALLIRSPTQRSQYIPQTAGIVR